MQRIDENTYIDDTLVTCAEYQLFIDEMREQGKYYQPDHWTSYQFPKGQAKKPILGVRFSDALAFCEWLTKREIEEEWMFRLSTQKEVNVFPMIFFGKSPVGYWIDKNYDFLWIKANPENDCALNVALSHTRALFSGLAVNIHNTRNRSLNVDRDFSLAMHRDGQNYNDRERRRRILIKHGIEAGYDSGEKYFLPLIDYTQRFFQTIRDKFDLSLYSNLSLNHSRDLKFNLTRDLNLNIELNRDLARELTRDLDLVIDLNLELAHDLDTLRLARDLTFALSTLEITRDLSQNHNPVLISALNRAFSLGIDITHNIALSQGQGIKIGNIDIVRANALALYILFDFFTLQERIAGRSPAFEGIRLVKERIK